MDRNTALKLKALNVNIINWNKLYFYTIKSNIPLLYRVHQQALSQIKTASECGMKCFDANQSYLTNSHQMYSYLFEERGHWQSTEQKVDEIVWIDVWQMCQAQRWSSSFFSWCRTEEPSPDEEKRRLDARPLLVMKTSIWDWIEAVIVNVYLCALQELWRSVCGSSCWSDHSSCQPIKIHR